MHATIKDTFQPNAVPAALAVAPPGTDGPGGLAQSVSAQVSDDGATTVVRYVNSLGEPVALRLSIDGFDGAANASCALRVMTAGALDAANAPGAPARVAPADRGRVPIVGKAAVVTVPAWSVSTFVCEK